jgi:hypothetical protein
MLFGKRALKKPELVPLRPPHYTVCIFLNATANGVAALSAWMSADIHSIHYCLYIIYYVYRSVSLRLFFLDIPCGMCNVHILIDRVRKYS